MFLKVCKFRQISIHMCVLLFTCCRYVVLDNGLRALLISDLDGEEEPAMEHDHAEESMSASDTGQ